MNITPFNDYTIVTPLKEDKASKSGILLPELEEDTVIGIGKVCSSENYEEGTIILYNSLSPFDFKIEDVSYLAVPSNAIIATVEGLKLTDKK